MTRTGDNVELRSVPGGEPQDAGNVTLAPCGMKQPASEVALVSASGASAQDAGSVSLYPCVAGGGVGSGGFSVPAIPVLTIDEATPTTLAVSWQAESGTPITNYAVTLTSGGEVIEQFDTEALAHEFTGLLEINTYTVTVVATNSEGDSEPGVIAYTLPPAPPFRGPAPGNQLAWADAIRGPTSTAPGGWGNPPLTPSDEAVVFGDTDPASAADAFPWESTIPTPNQGRADWRATERSDGTVTASGWRRVYWRPEGSRAPWGQGTSHQASAALPYNGPSPKRIPTQASWADAEETIRALWWLAHYAPPPKRQGEWLPWRQASRITWFIRPEPPPEPEPTPDPTGDCQAWPGDQVQLALGNVVLTIDGEPEQPSAEKVTAGRTLIVEHQFSLTRSSDGAKIDASDVQIGIDMDSWAWGWSARLLGQTAYNRVQPTAAGPVELTITIDGQAFRVLAEETTESRDGPTGANRQVSGRGIAARLGGPLAQPQSLDQQDDRGIQQLVDDELEFTGWKATWEPPTWIVPGGTFSYKGKTPIAAISEIAKAAGAFVLPGADSESIRIVSRYPVSPWDWGTATPDYIIGANPIKRISQRWTQRPEYDAVWVVGQQNGVIVEVTREGTAGTYQAPQVVDRLITSASAGRERGRVELSAGGAWQEVSLTIPHLDGDGGPGMILPGALVEVQDPAGTWRGIVKGMDIKANRTTADQTLQIDRRIDQ